MDRQNTLLDKGLLHYQKDELEESKKALQQIVKDDPKNLKALFFLGKIGLEEQNLASAIKHLSAAEKLNPKNVDVLNYFGLALLQTCQQSEFLASNEELKNEVNTLIVNKLNKDIYNKDVHDLLYIEADERLSKALKLNPKDTEIILNTAFCKEYKEKRSKNKQDYYYLSENPLELKKAKDIWFKLCFDKHVHSLASNKMREYPPEEENYLEILEYERLYQNRPELLNKAKQNFAKKYSSYVKNDFDEIKEFNEFRDLDILYLPNRFKEKFKSVLKLYQGYKDGKPLEDIVWEYHKEELDAGYIEDIRDCLILLNLKVIPHKIKECEVRMEDEYFQTGNKFKLLNQLKNLEKDFPRNIDIKIALQKLYFNEGKDLKAKEKLEEIVKISIEDSNLPTVKPLNKSKNDVWLIYSPFLSTALQSHALILKKSKDDASLRKEKKAITLLGKINEQYNLKLNLPKILLHKHEKDYTYLLTEAITKSDFRVDINNAASKSYDITNEYQMGQLGKIIESIAKVHAYIPENILKRVHTKKANMNIDYYTQKIKNKFFKRLNIMIEDHNLSIEQAAIDLANEKIKQCDEAIKIVENDNFEIKEPRFGYTLPSGRGILIDPYWKDYINKCKESIKGDYPWNEFEKKRVKRAEEEFKKISKNAKRYTSNIRLRIPLMDYGVYGTLGLCGLEPYNDFAKKIMSKEDYKEPLKKAFVNDKRRLKATCNYSKKEKTISQGLLIKEAEEKHSLKRIETRINEEDERKFFDDYSVILNIVATLKPGAHKDASLKNFLISDYHNIALIDFESLRNTPYQLDLAGALESIEHTDINVKRSLIKSYYYKFNEEINKPGCNRSRLESFEEFEKGYYACAIQKCFTSLGTAFKLFLKDKKHKYDYKQECETVLNNAFQNINQLKSYFPESSIEQKKLENLEKHLKFGSEYIKKVLS